MKNIKSKICYLLVLFLTVSFYVNTAHAAYEVEGSAVFSGEPSEAVIIDDVQITGTGSEPIPVKLLVSHGTLEMSVTTGLDFDGSETGSVLHFNGSLEDINNALATLIYTRNSEGSDTLEISLVNPGEVFFPGNGHLYEYISSTLTWTAAETAAEGLTRYGANGYLTTITSQEENDFVADRLENAGWMGARDETENDWKWVTGPEADTSFWSGGISGESVDGAYENWNGGEPNNSGGNEDCAQFLAGGSGYWNDLPCSGITLPGYVVEFGAEGNMPQIAALDIEISIETPPTPEEQALAKILEYSSTGGTGEEPTIEDYETAGIEGVTENSLMAINIVLSESEIEDLEDVQNIVDNVELFAPTILTTLPSSITQTSAILTGDITSAGTNFVTGQGFQYGKTTEYGSVLASSYVGVFDIGTFELLLEDLKCETTYHYRAYAENSEGVSYGDNQEFKTQDCPKSPKKGTSVSSQVNNLVRTGNMERAQELMQQYPGVFSNTNVGQSVEQTSGGLCNIGTIERILKTGAVGEDVQSLQKFLNCSGFILAETGAGSPGNETSLFSTRTYNALIKFQEYYASEILSPINLIKGTGIFGELSNKKARALSGQSN